MSGHSKWSTIKRKKGVADAKRGAVFTKLGLAITLAAKAGGGDLSSNFKLRLVVDNAKSANMPKDNIERAIKRGTGELEGGQVYELTYEAFGPGGVAIIIQAVTDNKNRTASEIKHTLSKHHGSLGEPGSVAWQFKEWGMIRLEKSNLDIDELSLQAIDLGAEDAQEEEDGILIKTKKQYFQQVKEGLEKAGARVEYTELELVPENYIDIDAKAVGQLTKLLEALEESDDVSECYTNTQI